MSNIKYILKLLNSYKKEVIVIILISSINSVLSLTIPFFMKFILDFINNKTYLTKYSLIFIALAFGKLLVSVFEKRNILSLIELKIGVNIQNSIYDSITKIDNKYFYKKDIIFNEKDFETMYLNDIEFVKSIVMKVIKLVTETLTFILYIFVIFRYSPILTLIIIFRIPVFFIVNKLMGKNIAVKNENVRSSYSKVLTKLKKIINSIQTVKIFNLYDSENQNINEESKLLNLNKKSAGQAAEWLIQMNIFVNSMFSIFVLTAGIIEVNKAKLTIGSLIMISNLQSRTIMPINFFSDFYIEYKKSFPSITRLVNFVRKEKEHQQCENIAPFKKLEYQNLNFKYGERNILSNIEFVVKKGDKIIITGDNMSGKSTLMNLICGLISPDSGNIKLNNIVVSNMDIRPYFKIFFQNQSNFEIFESLGSGGEIAMKNFKKVSEFQREIFIIDEADANLNESRLSSIYDIFRSNETVIMITHNNNIRNIIENAVYYELKNGTLSKLS